MRTIGTFDISPLIYTINGSRNTVLFKRKTINEYNTFRMPRSTYLLYIDMHE